MKVRKKFFQKKGLCFFLFSLLSGLFVLGYAASLLRAFPSERSSVTDCDGDGLPNAVEEFLKTNPLLYDTDGDGFSDGQEVALNKDPLDSQSIPEGNATGAFFALVPGPHHLSLSLVVTSEKGLEEISDFRLYGEGFDRIKNPEGFVDDSNSSSARSRATPLSKMGPLSMRQTGASIKVSDSSPFNDDITLSFFEKGDKIFARDGLTASITVKIPREQIPSLVTLKTALKADGEIYTSVFEFGEEENRIYMGMEPYKSEPPIIFLGGHFGIVHLFFIESLAHSTHPPCTEKDQVCELTLDRINDGTYYVVEAKCVPGKGFCNPEHCKGYTGSILTKLR